MSTAHAPGRRTPRLLRTPLRPLVLLAAAATALTGALAVPAADAAPGSEAAPAGEAASSSTTTVSDLTMVVANIKSSLSVERFQSDVREVFEADPDVITYNEVPLRVDSVLAPKGYAIYRSRKNRYTSATPVVWRTDRWTMVDSGTFRVSNYREIPKGRNIRLGLRFANWVTLQSADGRQLSVVAAHVAPLDDDMPDLLRPSVRRIGELVEKLSPAGPVLVGGDFNVHYKSGRYPRDLLTDAAMVPTYDTMGSYFATGDHHGATIDYVFNRSGGALGAQQQRSVELHSDHDAVVAGLGWLVDPPAMTQRFASDPTGDDVARRRGVAAVSAAVAAAEPDETIEIVTSGLALRSVFRKVRAAMRRGVEVRYLTRSPELTRRENGLSRIAASAGGSSVRQCRDACYRSWRQSDMARTFLLQRGPGGSAVKRVDANRVLNPVMLQERTRLVVRTGEIGLAEGETQLRALD